MPENPLVSAIIPAYNRPERTERAIKSVAEQTYEPIELIVVDDGSDPPLRESISTERESLRNGRLIEHETNIGANAARNTGIEAASGEYIAFLDSDDTWEPTKIEQQVRQFEDSSANVGLVYTGVRQVDESGETNAINTPDISGAVTKRLLLGNYIGTFSCVMVRESVFDTVEQLDERFPSWQDWEFYLRLSREYDIEAVPEPLVNRYIGGEQISGNYVQKRDESLPLLQESFASLAAEYGRLFQRKWRAHLNYHVALAALGNRNHAEGRRWLIRAVRWYPLIPAVYKHLLPAIAGSRVYELARVLKRKVVASRN